MSVLTASQRKHFTKTIQHNGVPCRMTVEVRHDDCCNNGENTFAITAQISGRGVEMGGRLHEEIVEHFPELAHLIKWHLCGTKQPMHYFSNTIYHAGDRDCWGLRKGEVEERSGRVGEGKTRDLDAARRTAIWPDATDEELMADDLRGRLADRLPGLLDEFKAAVEAFGFTY